MNDLNSLLDRAAGPSGASVDAGADLTRGHRALTRSRRRRGAAGLLGLAAAGVLGVTLTRGGADPSRVSDGSSGVADDPTVAPTPTSSPTPAPTQDTAPTPPPPTSDPAAPVTGSADPQLFAVPETPQGWEVQGSSPYGVTYARPGDTTVPEDFRGKIVLMFEANPPSGQKQVVGGRTFWVQDDTGGGYSRVTARTRAGEPPGLLSLQFPSADWSVEAAIAFLSQTRALDGAVAVAG